MARNVPRRDARIGGATGDGPPDRRLQRLRSIGAVAPHRAPRADLRPRPPPAPRRSSRGTRRWGDRHDRRSIGPFYRAQPAGSPDDRGEYRLDPRPARALPGLRRAAGRCRGRQLRLAEPDGHARFPAGRRQALHRAVHARQGLRPGAARSRPVVHGVQLHAPAGDRFPAPLPGDGRRAADGRRGPVGQHHGRPGAHPSGGGGERRSRAGPRAVLPVAARAERHEVRQERGRRLPVARRHWHESLRVLSVLAQRGRPRRRGLPALVHPLRPGPGGGVGGRADGSAGGATRSARAGLRPHGAGPRAGGRRRGRAHEPRRVRIDRRARR